MKVKEILCEFKDIWIGSCVRECCYKEECNQSQEAILDLLPKLELHTHNSIPSYTDDLEEGCSICIRNQALKDVRRVLS